MCAVNLGRDHVAWAPGLTQLVTFALNFLKMLPTSRAVRKNLGIIKYFGFVL